MSADTQLAVAAPAAQSSQALAMSVFATAANFENAQRFAKLIAASDLVPAHFKGRIENCVLGLEMANRLGASPLAVMQNLYIVHGRPAWSSQFLIAMVNACGRFQPMQFTTGGEGDDYGCFAWAKLKDGSDTVTGPRVTIGMAKAEGWFSKNGSKWQTMPELMLRYRAATFFARLYAPDLTLGMQTQEEVIDVPAEVLPARQPQAAAPDPMARVFQVEKTMPEREPETQKPQADSAPELDKETVKAELRSAITADPEVERLSLFKSIEERLRPWKLSMLDIHPALVSRKIVVPNSQPAAIMRATLRCLQRIDADLDAIAAETKEAKDSQPAD